MVGEGLLRRDAGREVDRQVVDLDVLDARAACLGFTDEQHPSGDGRLLLRGRPGIGGQEHVDDQVRQAAAGAPVQQLTGAEMQA
ncbi:hypothetical protein [Geodermatophilus telluris]|uniref:hypothetical protein n=1 Tax=Geodermatophilus telluris TaxID=1190417 RepID=UPI000B83971A|nr:hypothetical protein [Geodermatophilus telluris]